MNDEVPSELDRFVAPIVGLPTWGARQGYASFLSFQFGEPKLEIKEWNSETHGFRRHARVCGRWCIWIYCCEWRISVGEQSACNEDSRDDIARVVGMFDGQILSGVSVEPARGRSSFGFDLDGHLETWPVGDDPTEEQWFIYGPEGVFAYRADGHYAVQPADTPREFERWLPFP